MLSVSALINDNEVFYILLDAKAAPSQNGFVVLGAGNHGRARFDNFKIHSATSIYDMKTSTKEKTLEEQLAALMTENIENTEPVKTEHRVNHTKVRHRHRSSSLNKKKNLQQLLDMMTNQRRRVNM